MTQINEAIKSYEGLEQFINTNGKSALASLKVMKWLLSFHCEQDLSIGQITTKYRAYLRG